MTRLLATLCLLALATTASVAGCPVRSAKATLQIVEQAPRCEDAARLFRRCAIGTIFDGRLEALVKMNCEGRFLHRLKPWRRKAYETELDACDAYSAAGRGAPLLSRTAFCRVSVMEKYAKGR